MSFSRRAFLLGSTSILACSGSARAQYVASLELTLALDASSSMVSEYTPEGLIHWNIQLEGHIQALQKKPIIERLLYRKVYLRIIFWSGYTLYPAIFAAPIYEAADVARACSALMAYRGGCTYEIVCGRTIHASPIRQILALPQMGHRRVLDIATNEPTTSGDVSQLKLYRKTFSDRGGTVNALAVGMTPEGVADLEQNLCTADGFCLPAKFDADYTKALEAKILIEVG
jgi:hypothetical protein